jgi:ABC-type sugar transport system ATPase subunit
MLFPYIEARILSRGKLRNLYVPRLLARGITILFISSEMAEMSALRDHILPLCPGRLEDEASACL